MATAAETRAGWTYEAFDVVASLSAIALAACGLAGVVAPIMAVAATIVFGVALAANGARLLRCYARRDASGPLRYSIVVAGMAGAALAVIALAGADPAVLTPVASMVFGAGLVLKSNVLWELQSVHEIGAGQSEGAATGGSPAFLSLAGFTSGALGAIAAAGGPNDLTLNLAALIVAASALVLSSASATAVTARIVRPFSLTRHAVREPRKAG
jgi:hypothetical protein